jgi:transposase
MRKRYIVKLSEAERAQLHTMVGSGTAPARWLAHARILLKANQGEAGPGWTDEAIAGALEVGRATVARVRQTYVSAGLEAALARKTPERVYPRRLDGEQEAHLVALTCGTPPEGRQRWTLRLLAERLVALEVVDTVSHETVRQVLKQTNLSPGW